MRPSWYHKLKRDSSENTTYCQSARQSLRWFAHCSQRRRWFSVRGILQKGVLAHSPRCSRRLQIDEAHNETPVAINHCAANRLEEVVGSVHMTRTDRTISSWRHIIGSIPGFPICPILVRLLLSNTHHCAAVTQHTSGYYTMRQSSFTKADDSPPFKLCKMLKSCSLSSKRHK